MATKRKSAASGLEFPGQHVYVRTTNEDAEAPEHQARVQNWIQEYEKNRQVFVFPTPTVRTFSTLLLVLGLLSLLIQIASSSLRYAFVPSLLGSGIWIGMFCVATGAVGWVSSKRLSTSMLLDFNIMALIATALSAIIIVLNSIGLEMYTKLCFKSMIPTKENLITSGKNETELTAGQQPTTSSAAVNWIGECDQASFILMGIVVFIHVLLFLTSASCSSYICRALNSSYSVRVSPTQAPPLVIYHSDTVEVDKSGPGASSAASAGAAGVTAEKMMEKLHHPGLERGHEHHGGGFNTPAVP
ncbi:hypothetical protein DAPPUDRAFT_221246 [Daphnia pulex]|uniref:Uncharacterized protein n=1 Tax=Daphnia pulex TaxID=6669 RepID=E9FX64_DAPPU|nr:hypothetical protein DAPPUDRAFT_221246 [Daphnia pulex]|eukprot:EFX88022.1 hypothetical protein DAPPUDRAFT_221246 [Daphnia pulex]